jgi:hypothetical protein
MNPDAREIDQYFPETENASSPGASREVQKASSNIHDFVIGLGTLHDI